MGADAGVPVWGIEVGTGVIRAVRVSRHDEGGFQVLDFVEEETNESGPDSLLRFVRRKGLKGHALVVAVLTPSTELRTVLLPTAEFRIGPEELTNSLKEYVCPEPEDVEFRWQPLGEDRYVITGEEKARTESWLITLEAAALPACAVVTGLDALYGLLRRTGTVDGDCVVVRVQRGWTDVLFMDGLEVRHQGLPFGEAALDDDEKAKRLGEDLSRLIDYHRTRIPREEPERLHVLGVDEGRAATLAPHLPSTPVRFPDDSARIRGRGRISMPRAREIVRLAPAAAGAAIAGASDPRRLELAIRELPASLPTPPRPATTWLAASVLLWLAAVLTWYGITARRDELLAAAETPPPEAPALEAGTAERLRGLARSARLSLGLPGAVNKALRRVPTPECAPYRTKTMRFAARDEGDYEVRIDVRILAVGGDTEHPGVKAARARGDEPPVEVSGEDVVIRHRLLVEGGR